MYAPIGEHDLPAVAALMNRAYRGSGSLRGWSSEYIYITGDRTSEALLRADLAESPAAVVLKWQDAATCALHGCVWLEPLGEDRWYLGSLAIEPALQNGGHGRAMLEAAEAWVRQRGGTRIRMTVINVRETLIAWYVRRGYVDTGETEPFPYGDDRVGVPLRDDLCFVVLEKTL